MVVARKSSGVRLSLFLCQLPVSSLAQHLAMTELNIQDVLAWHLVSQDTQIPLVEAPSRLSLLSSPQLTLTLGSALAWPLGPKTM